jgi:hypothetical protein
MDISIKNAALLCLGVSGTVSVRRDIFGYVWGPMARTLSVKTHLTRIRTNAVNLCIFLVGHEPDFSGMFTPANAQTMQFAVDVTRELYAQVGVSVRKLFWRRIPLDEANGFNVVNASGATNLTEAFSGPNDGIDVFFVTTITDAGGWSSPNPGGGPCDKDEKGRTGAVLELQSTDFFTGVLMAHEVGHYLGLVHGTDMTNIMGADTNNDGIGEINSGSTGITTSQGNTMKSHCSIRLPC